MGSVFAHPPCPALVSATTSHPCGTSVRYVVVIPFVVVVVDAGTVGMCVVVVVCIVSVVMVAVLVVVSWTCIPDMCCIDSGTVGFRAESPVCFVNRTKL